MTPKGYIFDYGGTLDTGGCHWGKVLWHGWQRAGVPVTEVQFREAYVHAERTLGKNPIIQPDYTFYKTLETKVRLELDYLGLDGYVSAIVNGIYEETRHHTAHSREVLQQLQVPMVLVSNFYGNISTVLREFGFDELFQAIVESAVVGVRKPDPRIFTLGVKALGMQPSEVVVVGDSMDKDIIPAHKAGCQTVWVRGEQWTDDPIDEHTADRVIDDLSELLGGNRCVG